MNCTKGKALLVAGLVLVMTVGAYAEQQQQQQQQMRQVQGEITSLQTQNVNNQQMMVAEVETQDGQTMQVILGSPDQLRRLDLQEGDQIQAQGSRTQFQGQSALRAQQIRANNQRVRIQQQGGMMQQQQGRRMGQQQQGGFQPSLIQANNLIGKEVMSQQDESLGTIEELVLHADQSQIQYAVLSAGEALDMQGQICLVPWKEFEVQGEQEQVEVMLLMDQSQLMNLPNYEENDWQNASMEDVSAEIEQHFGQQQGGMQQGQMQGRQRQQPMGGRMQQQQQGSQMQQVQGQITSLQRQQINNQQQIVAEIETQDGQTKQVILGSPDQLGQISLLPGDQISVQGSQTQLQGQSAIQARQIRANNQQIQIQPQGSQRQQMQSGQQQQRQQDSQYGETLGMDRRNRGGAQMRSQQDDTDYFILYDEGDPEIYRESDPMQQRQMQGQAQQYFKLTNLIGMDVEDQQQEQFGSLEDIIVDTREGRLVYGIVSYGGFLGIAEDMAAVPWNSLEIMPQENMITMNANQDVLDQFAFEPGDIQRLEDQQYSRRLHEQFNEEPYWVVYGYAPADTQGQRQPQGRMTQGRMQQSRRQQSQVWGESGTYSQAFDPANTQSYSGTIQSTGTFRLGQGAMDGLRLRIRTDEGQTQTVYAGPRAYVNQQGIRLQNGDQVEITAAEGNLNNRQVLIASEIKKDDQTLTLFDDQGKPSWNAENLMQGGMQPRNGEEQPQRRQQQPPQNGEQQKQQKQQQQSQNGESQSGQMKQVQGEITRLQMQQVKNQRQMVAEVKTQNGQTQQVILGSPDELGQLNLKQGDQIQVSGQSTQLNQKSAIQAQEIRANNQQVKVGQGAGASSSMGGGS